LSVTRFVGRRRSCRRFDHNHDNCRPTIVDAGPGRPAPRPLDRHGGSDRIGAVWPVDQLGDAPGPLIGPSIKRGNASDAAPVTVARESCCAAEHRHGFGFDARRPHAARRPGPRAVVNPPRCRPWAASPRGESRRRPYRSPTRRGRIAGCCSQPMSLSAGMIKRDQLIGKSCIHWDLCTKESQIC
jgi:hypothetical protein